MLDGIDCVPGKLMVVAPRDELLATATCIDSGEEGNRRSGGQ